MNSTWMQKKNSISTNTINLSINNVIPFVPFIILSFLLKILIIYSQLEAPRVVHVYHQFRQPVGENVCEENGCEHFCLRNTHGKPFCSCADGFVPDVDPLKCIEEHLRKEIVEGNTFNILFNS